jgi:hypothetical protein
MRESSYRTARTSQAKPKPRAEIAKSLFGNILAVSPCPSRFCPDLAISKLGKLLKTDTLAGSSKKNERLYQNKITRRWGKTIGYLLGRARDLHAVRSRRVARDAAIQRFGDLLAVTVAAQFLFVGGTADERNFG